MKSNYLRKTYAHFSADQVSMPSIRVTYFENLQVTNIITLYSFAIRGNAYIKSRVKVKKSMDGLSMG